MTPHPDVRDDAVLLRAVARGDEDALATLYDRHAAWLTIRLSRRCGRPDVVDHAVQDTFLAVWRDARAYRGDGAQQHSVIPNVGVRRHRCLLALTSSLSQPASKTVPPSPARQTR